MKGFIDYASSLREGEGLNYRQGTQSRYESEFTTSKYEVSLNFSQLISKISQGSWEGFGGLQRLYMPPPHPQKTSKLFSNIIRMYFERSQRQVLLELKSFFFFLLVDNSCTLCPPTENLSTLLNAVVAIYTFSSWGGGGRQYVFKFRSTVKNKILVSTILKRLLNTYLSYLIFKKSYSVRTLTHLLSK